MLAPIETSSVVIASRYHYLSLAGVTCLLIGVTLIMATRYLIDEKKAPTKPKIYTFFGGGVPPRSAMTETGKKVHTAGYVLCALGGLCLVFSELGRSE